MRIKIQGFDDRNNVLIALANNGYRVKVEVEKDIVAGDSFYINFEE